MTEKAKTRGNEKEIKAERHLIDSMIIDKIMDHIIELRLEDIAALGCCRNERLNNKILNHLSRMFSLLD